MKCPYYNLKVHYSITELSSFSKVVWRSAHKPPDHRKWRALRELEDIYEAYENRCQYSAGQENVSTKMDVRKGI